MSGLKQQARVMAAVNAHSFAAYVLRDGPIAHFMGAFDLAGFCAMLADPLSSGLLHKDTLLVHERHDGLRVQTLRAYKIRKGSPIYVRHPRTGLVERTEPLKADEVFAVQVDSFVPTRPFDALRDDPTGVDFTLVEGQA